MARSTGIDAYMKARVEPLDIPNVLDREFTVSAPNEVWCGDITYTWAQSRWHSLAAVIDLFAHRVVGWAFSTMPDADRVIKALEKAYEPRHRSRSALVRSD